ncbi:MAG TPA: gephyrin-like molybdotransferase Glp [Fimbriimonadaceae bacterium]|nr:gephyrin-like molybdotransferase Glp [Fimbriimonadaceae bacterium]
MISYEEAIRIVDSLCHPLDAVSRRPSHAGGYALAEDLYAKCASPPFDNSAVDGYGRRLEDLEAGELRLCGEVKAGDDGLLSVPPGHAVRIFTGAPIPSGIAAVGMQEDCREKDGAVRFLETSHRGDHIRPAGSDFAAGQLLLKKGEILNPASIGLAISGGHLTVKTLWRPRVTILTTGNELVPPGEELGPGQIYNSNEGALSAALEPLSGVTRTLHVGDDLEQLKFLLPAILQDSDVVLTCGGVSVGEYDFLKEAFAACGVEQRFWQVAIKPGKPVYFGTWGRSLVFGLPGNPVSALVTFYLFVRPALLKLSGRIDEWSSPIQARFEGESHKKGGRMEFLRGVLADGQAREAGAQGSHQLAALAAANCLVHFPREAERLRTGDKVEVTPIEW